VRSQRAADRHAAPEKVAFKFMMWSWKLDDQLRDGLTTRQFIRCHRSAKPFDKLRTGSRSLMCLHIGDDLTHIRRGGQDRGIASVEEVLALRPELQPIS